MKACENTRRELFESVSDNGTRWAYLILPDDRWAITCNGQRVAVGTADRTSIQAGIEKFATLTHPPAGASPCDPVVQEHLDRIERSAPARHERERSAALRERTIDYERRCRPAPKVVSACLHDKKAREEIGNESG